MLFESSAPNRGNYPMVEVRGQRRDSNYDWYEPKRGRFATIFGVAFRGQTYRHAAYLILALPLGIIYFALTMAVLSVGGGLAIALIGLVILGLAMFAWPVVAEMERRLSNHMLRTRIDPLTFNAPDGPGLWPQVVARLTSVSTWQSLLYLAVRLPIGIVAFVITVVSFALVLVTGTMSLHIVNAIARLVGRINTVLLQSWSPPAAVAHAAAAVPAAPTATTEAPAAPSPTSGPAAAQPGPGSDAAPFSERARRSAATFTDRVQEVTDELSERARAAARGWSQPAGTRTAEPAAGPAAATTVDREAPPASGDEEPEASADESAERARVTVDVAMRVVTVNDEEVELTPKEFDLIVLFVQHPGRPFSRDELLDRIWRNDYEVTDRTIDTHIQRLRKKLGNAAELIQTVWGVGYKYQPPRD